MDKFHQNNVIFRFLQVETKGDSTVKRPTAEAIAMLQKRRAAAKAANAGTQSAQPLQPAASKNQPVDVCARARELTMKAKAAANLNKHAPPPKAVAGEVDILNSFMRQGSQLGNIVAGNPTQSQESEAVKQAREAADLKMRQARSEAARADRESGHLRAGSGATVKVPSAEAIAMLKARREKAAAEAKMHQGPAKKARV